MARRKSALLAKAEQSHKREFRITYGREHRDDGFLRRLDNEPILSEKIRENSRGVTLTGSQAATSERGKRAIVRTRSGNDAVEMRAALVPITKREKRAAGITRAPWKPDVRKTKVRLWRGRKVAATHSFGKNDWRR